MTDPLTLQSHPQGVDMSQSQTEGVELSSRYQILVHTVRGEDVTLVICVGVEYTWERRERGREAPYLPEPLYLFTVASVVAIDRVFLPFSSMYLLHTAQHQF